MDPRAASTASQALQTDASHAAPALDVHARAHAIRRRAHELGFSHAGIARAEALEPERAHLLDWLAHGWHAGMAWMERDPERRTDPRLVLPGARSVIAVSWNYYHPAQHPAGIDHAKISRYAWGDDYHDTVTPRVRELAAYVDALVPGSESRVYVDTGPSMDKAWAVRAGIGWLGKHGNVITRDRGSWIFLGVIFTTADAAIDTPVADRCGSCTRCIDACPTHAIVAPQVVDSNRCLPYLTIEHKGDDIPGAAQLAFDNWVFGCDVCQDVCPWNRFAQDCGDPASAPRAGMLELTLGQCAHMSDEDFRARFRGSPVARTKARGLRRNARTVLAARESHTDMNDTRTSS